MPTSFSQITVLLLLNVLYIKYLAKGVALLRDSLQRQRSTSTGLLVELLSSLKLLCREIEKGFWYGFVARFFRALNGADDENPMGAFL